MEGSEAADKGQLLVGVAVTGSRKGKHILKWAAEKFRPEGNVTFKILHVYPKIDLVPTLMGTWLPVTKVREEVVAGYRKDVQGRKLKKLLPYYQTLKEQKIKSDIALLESDDIAMALSLETTRLAIRHLVIGISSRGIFSMKKFSLAKGEDLSQVISETAPNFCTVYVVADGKLQQLRPADSEQTMITTDDTNNLSSASTNGSSSSSSLTTGTMINAEPTNLSLKTIYKETNPVGTLCYIDPEYQRTGRVSPKSDIYALGIVILQLLTAKPAVGIAFAVEDAIDEGTLIKVLDPEAEEWPEKETLELDQLGLQCAELRGRDRPDLREKVLPLLERLKEMADNTRASASNSQTTTPAHFFCPLLKDVMEDPYVAADGYTYDRRAIEQWLKEHNTSPTTKQPLPHKFIMPNTTVLEAIKQWKSK